MPNDDPTVGTGWGPGEQHSDKFRESMRGIDQVFGSSGSIPVTRTDTKNGTRLVRVDDSSGSGGSGCSLIGFLIAAGAAAASIAGAKYGVA